MIKTTAVAWLTSLAALLVASAGLFAVSATSTTTSTTRMAVAAGVLSALAAVGGLVVTDPWERTVPFRVLWGGTVPLACGVGTAMLVGTRAGASGALLAGLPWLVGAAVVCAFGALLPDLRLTTARVGLRRLRERARWLPDSDER
jgi:hypothetical protein